MARKRLSGPLPDYLVAPPVAGQPPPLPRAPIAQVAGESAALAAFEAVSAELTAAREEGRMVLSLPLSDLAADYLIRDRIAPEPEAMVELAGSLRARGQQAPVEVVDRGEGAMPRYGLISGWRRLLALQALHAETGEDRFARVLARVRRPEGGAEAYVAMVEENEIRAGLSFYERARIVMRAVEAGVYPTEKAALQGLFATASFAKRSKVKSFIGVVEALDGALAFPARIPERTGLALAKALSTDPGFAARARAALTPPAPTPEAEAAVLAGLLRRPKSVRQDTESDETVSVVEDMREEVRVTIEPGQILLTGPGATPDLARRVRLWLAGQGYPGLR